MRLRFPTRFNIVYPHENASYYTGVAKNTMLNLLLESCDNYCMYCGKDIKTDNKYEFNMEHSIDKSNDEKDNSFLKNCKYNLSISCPNCNQKYKTRMIDDVDDSLMSVCINCLEKECLLPCNEYVAVFNDYISKNKIILQPNNINAQLENMKIDYNLIKHIFEPSAECVNQDDRNFISEHIARFHLNKEMYTESVLEICEGILKIIKCMDEKVDIKQVFILIKKNRYENVIKKIFIEYLSNIFTGIRELKNFCEFCIILSYM